jgi:NADH-quinone oxidoreductase subunit H
MLDRIAQALLFPGLTWFVCLAFLFEWLERKTIARMQGRIGPLVAGPAGILQPVADFFKLVFREEVLPAYADRFLFRYAPPLFFTVPALGTLFIPVVNTQALLSHELDLFFIIFLFAFSALMAATLSYATAGPFATIAIGRLVLQYVSYEIPLILAVITPALYARTLSISGIVAAQSQSWFIVVAPLGFAVFILATLAELEKPPFDIPSAKTEIVAGWMTEFSGRPLAFLRLSKNLTYAFASALGASLFLGGAAGPVFGLGSAAAAGLHFTYFLAKLLLVGFVIFALRTAMARLKIGQATHLFWTMLAPLALVQIFLVLVLV